ncbi:hypothetical protein QAD02_016135 [Eretmocerus hayati]|uniref:Uncharacterized protein n=1 Tax=Eretmocerus hayati TaxID=131215 RepID=A0ACC2PA83_9HYME|nr:hypothetical protein QAD02_016135 [Eretmocerus hayati]
MFKKFKDKLAEEMKQSPARLQAGMQQLAQAVGSPSLSSGSAQDLSSSRDNFSLTDEIDDTPRNSPGKHGFQTVELTPPSVNSSSSRRSSLSSNVSEASFLFPVYESPGSIYHLQPDIDQSANELDEKISPQLDQVSKEQLYAAYSKARTKYDKYRERFTDLANHYRDVERAKSKLESLLVETQDKALRRISDLKEQCQLEQQAKAHLEDALRNDLEEKDHVINSLKTKIKLLQEKGLSTEALDGIETAEIYNGNKVDEYDANSAHDTATQESGEAPRLSTENVQLKDKLQKLESLVEKYKDMLKRNKDKVLEITNEKTTLERDYDHLQKSSKGKLQDVERDLRDARDKYIKLKDELEVLKKREEESAISLAENKLSIHRELEHKEEQIKQLQSDLKQARESEMGSQKIVNLLKQEVDKMKLIAEQNAKANQELLKSKSDAVKQLQNEMQQKLLELEKKMGSKYHEEVKKNEELLSKLQAFENVSHSSHNETGSTLDLPKELQEKLRLLEDLKNREEEYKRNLNLQKMDNSNLKEELEKTRSCLESAKNDSILSSNEVHKNFEEKVAHLENLLEQKDQVCSELTSQVEKFTQAMEEMKSKLKKQDEKLRILKNQASDEQSAGLQEELDNKDLEILGLSSEIKSYSKTISDLKKEIASHVSYRKNINKYLKACRKTLKNLKEEHISLKSHITDRISDGKRAISELAAQANTSCSCINQSYISLQTKVADSTEKTKVLEKSMKHSEESKFELEKILDEKVMLEKQLKSKCDEVEELKIRFNELEELRSKNQELIQQVEHLTLQLKDSNILCNEKEKLLHEVRSEKENILKNASLEAKKNDIVLSELKSQLSEKVSIVENYNNLLNKYEESVNTVTALKSENEDRNKLLEKIQTLNTQLESLQEELNHKITESEEMNKKLVEFDRQSSETQSERNNDKKLLQEHQKRISSLTEELETLKSTHRGAIEELNKTKDLLLQEQESNNNLSKKLENLEIELEKTLYAKNNLESNFEKLQLHLRDIQIEKDNAIKKQAEEIEEAMKSNSKLESDIAILEASKSDLIRLQSENHSLSIDLNELKILCDTQEKENETLKQKQDDALKANDELTQSQSRLIQKLQSLEKDHQSLATEKSNLLQEVENFRNQVEDANSRIEMVNNELDNMNQFKSRIIELETELMKASTNDEHILNLEATKQELTKHNEILTTQVKSLQDELSRLRENHTNDLDREVGEYKKKICDLQSNLSAKDEELKIIELDNVQRLQSLKLQLDERIDEIDSQKAKIIELMSSKEDMEQKLNLQISGCQKQIENIEVQLLNKESELSNWKGKYSKLEKDLEMSLSNRSTDEQMATNLESIVNEKREAESKLKEILVTSQAKEDQMQLLMNDLRVEVQNVRDQMKQNEEEHNLRLKQIVKEFQAQLSDKERELQAALDRRFDDQQNHESDTVLEYREQLKDFQVELTRKSEEIEKLKSEKQIKVDELTKTIDQIKLDHKKRIQELDTRWKAIVEQKTAQLDNRHQNEVVRLTNEWQSEKKELENTTKVAMATVQSNTGSFHTLQQTLTSQKQELTELRKLVKMRQDSVEDSTEIEYLRNILYKYMMGKETMVLARVIAAVVKFDQEQTATILKKEEDKLSLLGSLGLT